MSTMEKVCLAAVAFALIGLSAGCGPIRCDPPEYLDPIVTLNPDSVLAGTEITVVASFDQPLFDSDADFGLPFQDVVVVDAATDEWIGTFDDDWLGYEWYEGPFVSGVVLSGEVIDDRSIELTLEFPNELIDGAIVRMRASNNDPHCLVGVSGEAPLAVDFVQ